MADSSQAMEESIPCFADIPVIAVASNMFPFLESRTDWNNFALVSKEIYKAVTEHKDLSPPWPDCQLSEAGEGASYCTPIFSHDGELIAYGNGGGRISIWSRRKALVASWKGHDSHASDVSFSPCSNLLLSIGGDKRINLWDLDNHNRCLWTQQDVGSLHQSKIVFSPSGDVFATFGYRDDNPGVFLRNTSDGSLSKTLTSVREFHGGAFSPDGRTLAVRSSHQNTIELWDHGDSESTAAHLVGHTSYLLEVAYSPDGKFLASASQDKTIKIWNVANQQCIHTLTGRKRYERISYSPDGKFLASGGKDGYIRLWSMANGRCVKKIKAAGNKVPSVAFSPDGKMLLTKEGLTEGRGRVIIRLRYVRK
jgi:WD40 repeat protein